MKKTLLSLATLAACCTLAASAAVVSYDYAASTNGTAYAVGLAWTPAAVTAYGLDASITVQRVHAGSTNTLGTVTNGTLNAAVAWGSLVPGDQLILSGGLGTVEIQGTK